MRIAKYLLAPVLAGVLFTACSYKLVKETDASLPSGLASLSIPLAANRTLEAGLEDLFTQELIHRLAADGRVRVLAPGQAEAELKCTLGPLDTRSVSFSREGKIAAEKARLECQCVLVIPESESVVWKSGPLASEEEYAVGDDYLLNEQARKTALQEIARDLSETVRTLLLDEF